MPRTRILKLRRNTIRPAADGSEQVIYSLAVPREIGELLDGGQYFTAELTEDGILYRPVRAGEPPLPDDLPAWVRNDKAPKKKGR